MEPGLVQAKKIMYNIVNIITAFIPIVNAKDD